VVDFVLFDKLSSEGLHAMVLVIDQLDEGVFKEVLDVLALQLFGLGLDVVLKLDKFLVFLPIMTLLLLADLSRVQFGLLFGCSQILSLL
jgi:hypothetical protein